MKTILILSILAFVASSCGRSNKTAETDNYIEVIIDNPFLGKWYSVERIIPFSATLDIDSNYNFIYEGGACEARFLSKGYWVLNGDTLVLNSFEPEDCYYISEFGKNHIVIPIDTFPYFAFEVRTSIEDCIPIDYYEYIVFTNEKFIIEDSVLTHIRRKPNLMWPEIKDNFTRNRARPW